MSFFRPEDFLVDHGALTPTGMAAKANALLESRGVRVYKSTYKVWHHVQESGDDLTGLVVCIQPIAKPDTAESLLREVVKCWDSRENEHKMWDVVTRAKALLWERD